MIVPAGNKNVEWSPKETVLTKTASAGAEVQEEVNPLYEAAKKYAESTRVCEKCHKPGALCECAKSSSKGSSDVKSAACMADEVAVVEVDDGAVVDGAPEAGKDPVEVAVEKIEEGVAEIKDAQGIPEKTEGADIKVEDTGESKSLDIPGKEVQDSEIIVKSEPADACACAAAAKSDAKSDAASSSDAKSDKKSDLKAEVKEEVKVAASAASSSSDCKDAASSSSDAKSDKKAEVKIELEKAASVEEKFCKLSHISPANRKKVTDYWVNMLNYPKDFVALMVKDYEK